MTRFARAKGSKSSNERAPEDSTPWEVMKEQLLQAKKDSDESKMRNEAEQKRIENYENFLKDRKVQKRKATWCDFPESEQKKNESKLSDNSEPLKKTKKKNKRKEAINVTVQPEHANKDNCKDSVTESNSKVAVKTSKINKNKLVHEIEQSKPVNSDSNVIENVSKDTSKKSKKKKKAQTEAESENQTQTPEVTKPVQNNTKNKKKKQKKKNAQANDNNTNSQVDEAQSQPEDNPQNNNNNRQNSNKQQPKNKKNKKLVNGKPVRRKDVDDRSFQLIINGKEVELVRFDGFPVMKKDAERLQELKDSMIKKGIPKSEVQRTIKLERRRAEKALARVKRDVCYNCRKGGHVLSDCPDLKSKIPGADGADGVCFKCGSTEHRQFECKVQRDKEFRFATCFICKEPGHIARQCPDNPKGLYPNGGSCKLCGDVTHLRKDCPTVMDKKEGSTVKLHTLDSGDNIEDVAPLSNKFTPADTSNKKPKKITF